VLADAAVSEMLRYNEEAVHMEGVRQTVSGKECGCLRRQVLERTESKKGNRRKYVHPPHFRSSDVNRLLVFIK